MFIKIRNDRYNRFVIFIANYECFSIAKISRNGWNNRIVPEDTRQINKTHSFINERNFDKVTFAIIFIIDVTMKSMLRISSS